MQNRNFKQRVIDVVKQIPRGKTLTYQQVAKLAGSPKAFRAVGQILKQNYDNSIPCHRVIKSNGDVGDYNRGGSVAKQAILDSEKSD